MSSAGNLRFKNLRVSLSERAMPSMPCIPLMYGQYVLYNMCFTRGCQWHFG